ncbi:MAG: hypothetical protein Kow0026_23450 [Oricola sp.]
MLKPKILIFIPSPNEVQRFVIGRAFEKLVRHFDVVYVLPEAERERMLPLIGDAVADADIEFFDIDADRFKSWSRLFKAACYQYAHKSRSFALRIDAGRYSDAAGARQLTLDRGRYGGKTLIGGLPARLMARVLPGAASRKKVRRESAMRMFNPKVYADFREKTLASLGRNKALEALIAEHDPLVVIVPSSLLDIFCNDVIWAAGETGYTSIVLQSGWDNLSSKGILQHLPDYMGVWGEQSAGHATAIQGMDKRRLVRLGAPHYEVLSPASPDTCSQMRAELGVGNDEKLVLFGGSFRQFDETAALHELEAHIENRNLNCKILYRPHPYRLDREGEADFFEIDWKHIVFDPEMRERYRHSKAEAGYIKRERPIYSMEYLASVISAADAVMSPMSTLLLESMIIGKPSMAIAFSDDRHVYNAATASDMTHFSALKKRDAALIWCATRNDFLSDFDRLISRKADKSLSRAQGEIIANVVTREPGTYAERLMTFMADVVAPAVLDDRREKFGERKTINESYAADNVLRAYSGEPSRPIHIPGYWMHGWLPEYFNRHYGLIALHKKMGIRGKDRVKDHEIEKETEYQWVSRQDQADFLSANGYKKVRAIGLPFAYLPEVQVERRAGSLLLMPPHGRREYFRGNRHAQAYVNAILDIRDRFSEIVACVTERDYCRGEWRQVFQDAGIPVIIGSNHYDRNPLLRMKEILSRFEFVTTNAFGSQIAYAAFCGAKVSVFGPFCEWPRNKSTHAVQMFPELADALVDLQSEATLREHFPFLFRHPADAEQMIAWGANEIGMNMKLSPTEVRTLFGR